MKVMIRRNRAGVLSAYIAKKDLEEPIVESERPELWGGLVKLANGWRLALPAMESTTELPITVEARKLGEMEI
jgi:nitrogen fixation protein NifT